MRVLDLTTVVFGPLATQILADYGAEVIKIEPPEGDVMRHAGAGGRAGMGPIFLNLNRGKRSVAIDLKRAEGKALLRALVPSADVFVHNVRRRAIARLGFGYDDVKALNPAILYAAATGFAAAGDRADAAAIDDVIQSSAGLAALNAGRDGLPQLVQSLIADKISGLGLACAVLAGLVRRARTGAGGEIDLPMHETVAGFLLVEHLQGATFDPPRGAIGYHRVTGRGRRLYRARDGFVSMTPYSGDQWAEFFRATGRPELANDRRITDPVERNAHIAELYDLIEAVAGARTVAEWEALGRELGFPAQAVRSLADVAADPGFAAAGGLAAREQPGVGTARMLASPGYFAGAPARDPQPAPRLGEHTRAVLGGCGIDPARLDDYAARGIIGVGADR